MPSRHLYALLSALVPGLGQLVAGRWRDAAMFLFATAWFGLFLMAADPSPGFVSRLPAFFLGAPAIDGPSRPIIVVFTVLLFALRVLAAWSLWAVRGGSPSGLSGPPARPPSERRR